MASTGDGGRRLTASKGASSGVETYPLALALVLALAPVIGLRGCASLVAVMLVTQLTLASPHDLSIYWHSCFSQKFGPAQMRNATIGFAQCVRPGGRPTSDHCLALFDYHPLVTSAMFAPAVIFMLSFGPLIALIRVFYPEHRDGVNRGQYLKLWTFFLRHPCAVQGEGPSNGDGLAGIGASESIIYPLTRAHLQLGPTR